MSAYRPGRILTRLFRVRFPSRLYDWNAGWLLGSRLCRLTHVGRRSGRSYRTVLEVAGSNAVTGEVMIVSGFGRKADWYRNLHANGSAEIETGRRRFTARYRDLAVDEAVEVLAAYERRYRLIAPLVRHLLGKLAGRRYDGTEDARRELAEQLPIVAFAPDSAASGPGD